MINLSITWKTKKIKKTHLFFFITYIKYRAESPASPASIKFYQRKQSFILRVMFFGITRIKRKNEMKLSDCPTWTKISPAMQTIVRDLAKSLGSAQAALWYIADNSELPEYGVKFMADYELFGELWADVERMKR